MSQKLYFGTSTPIAARTSSTPRRRTPAAYDRFEHLAHEDFMAAQAPQRVSAAEEQPNAHFTPLYHTGKPEGHYRSGNTPHTSAAKKGA